MKIPIIAGLTFTSIIALCLSAFFSIGTTGCASNGTLTPAAQTDASNVENALLTAANVLQQLNTGLQTAAPTVETLLTLTHNQGDAQSVNNIVATTAAATPALTTLLANVQTAIKAATTPASQIAAVNAATTPAAIAQIVAPIAAAAPSTSMLKIHADLRNEYGSTAKESIYDLHKAGQKPRTMVASQDDGAPIIF